MSRTYLPLSLALSACLLTACVDRVANGSAAGAGLDLAGMDTSVKPGDDFFAYVNGTWVKTSEIPADRSNWGVFAELREKADKRTADLVQAAADAKAQGGTEQAQVGDYYASYLDEAGIDAKGLTPLQPAHDHNNTNTNKTTQTTTFGAQLRADVDALNNTNFH